MREQEYNVKLSIYPLGDKFTLDYSSPSIGMILGIYETEDEAKKARCQALNNLIYSFPQPKSN